MLRGLGGVELPNKESDSGSIHSALDCSPETVVSRDAHSSTHGSAGVGSDGTSMTRELGGVELPNEYSDTELLLESQSAERSTMGLSALNSEWRKARLLTGGGYPCSI